MYNHQPLISIGMPVRNSEKTLAMAVRSLLNQTCTNWELLLIDDGSTDETVRAARGFEDPRIKLLVGRRTRGLSVRLNQAVERSRGELFARMDGDDVAYPERFERQVEYLRKHPEVSLVGSQVLVFGEGGRVLGKRESPEHHRDICATPTGGMFVPHPTFMGRIDFFRRYRYTPWIHKSEDQDLLIRAYENEILANVPQILLGYREERLNLKKLLVTRRFAFLMMLDHFTRLGHPFMALKAAGGQAGKAAVETVAITTGLNYRILKHRAQPTTPEERREWARVWKSVSEG